MKFIERPAWLRMLSMSQVMTVRLPTETVHLTLLIGQ